MKRLIMMLVVTVFAFSMTQSAFAGNKVPKELCFTGAGGTYSLAFKKLTKIKAPNGKKTFYAVHGEYDGWNPLVGTAYMSLQQPTFLEASFMGNYYEELRSYNFIWDTTTDTGQIYYTVISAGGTTSGSGDVTIEVCAEKPWDLETPLPPVE